MMDGQTGELRQEVLSGIEEYRRKYPDLMINAVWPSL